MAAREDQTILDEITEDLWKLFQIEKRPLRHYLSGFEAEFIILDNNGFVSNAADTILKKSGTLAKKECARNMLEIATIPAETTGKAMGDMLERTQNLIEIMEKDGHTFYFYATYPGRFNPSMRKEKEYGIKQRIFGHEKFKIAGRCVGFHCHYNLPRGAFDYVTKRLNVFIRERASRSLVSSYNILIAIDPAITAFAQSSPYYQGKLYGKDSRIMFYRGNDIFNVDGLYTHFQDFGGLPQYKHTLIDIMQHIEDRFKNWSRQLRQFEINVRTLALYGSVLDTNWAPLKINPLGTFEVRGMDMNRFDIITANAVCLKYILRSIQRNRLNVVTSKDAINEPFKLDGKKILIPPYNYVRDILQRESALYGMESPAIRNYCSRFLDLSKSTLPSDMKKFLKPMKRMVRRKRTVSDEIISKAKKMGYRNYVPNDAAAELALKLSENIRKNVEKTRRLVAGLE